MNKKLILFEECELSQKKTYAQLVLTGEAQICVFIDDSRAFMLPADVRDYDSLHWDHFHFNEYYKAPTWRSVLSRFGSGKLPEPGGEGVNTGSFNQKNWYFEREEMEWLDSQLLNNWIRENGLLIERGVYPLCEKSATDIAMGIVKGWVLKDGVEFTIWRMMRIEVNGKCRPIAKIGDLIMDGGRALVWPDLYERAKSAFLINSDIEIDAQQEPNQSVTRSRQSDLDYLIGLYLDETSNQGGAPGLFRFMVDRGAEAMPGERVKWTDATGQIHKIAFNTVKNKLTELKKKRRNQKP